MLDVKRLRVLREVARSGSFSAAAETLGYTQPAVSRQISTLEAEAGGGRPGGGAWAGGAAAGARRPASPSAAAAIAPPTIATFRERHPHVELLVDMLESSD